MNKQHPREQIFQTQQLLTSWEQVNNYDLMVDAIYTNRLTYANLIIKFNEFEISEDCNHFQRTKHSYYLALYSDSYDGIIIMDSITKQDAVIVGLLDKSILDKEIKEFEMQAQPTNQERLDKILKAVSDDPLIQDMVEALIRAKDSK